MTTPLSPTRSTASAATQPPQSASFTGTGAALLVECLHRAGVTTIFGVPGDTGVGLYEALYHRTDDVEHVLARDERHASAMADAYARVSNTVGVVEVSSGGGTTYAVGGLGEAFAASVPVLLITSDIHRNSRNSGALTEIDQEALFSGVTKWRRVVEDANDIPALLAEALENATGGRPAPVALIFPEDVLDQEVSVVLAPTAERMPVEVPRSRAAADDVSVGQIAAMLQEAKKPAIVVGSGIHLSEAWSELAALADAVGAPVATSIHGKGAIADTAPWALGVVGANGARDYANAYLSSADAVLFIGTRANSTDTNGFTAPARTGVSIASIDICSIRVGRNFPDGIRAVGDARTVLQQLVDAISPLDEATRTERLEKLSALRAAWQPAKPTAAERAAEEGALLPQHLYQVALEVLGARCIVIADPGTPTPNAASYWDTSEPGRTVIVPRGHGPMGYAIPAAVGAAFARPGETILSFTADGSFAMACGELETVNRFQLPIIYVQLTNYSMGWIKMLQHLYFDEHYFGVDPGPTDAVMVAAASGLKSVRVRSLDEFAAVLTEAVASRKPIYIDVVVPHMIELAPPVAPWQAALLGDSERPVY